MNLGLQLMAAAASRENSQAPTLQVRTQEINAQRQHYAEIGRTGGLKGGVARAQALTPERRSEIARMGALARKEKLRSPGD